MNPEQILDQAKRHERTVTMLAEEEAAFNTVSKAAARAIMLRREYTRMNETEIVKAVPPSDFIAMVSNATRDPAIEPMKLKELLEMAERMMKFEAEREFNNEMRACQEEIAPIAKTAENTHTGTKYTPLEAIDQAIRPVYTRHGFVMSFSSGPGRGEHSVRVTCDVRHSSGHTVQYELEGELDTSGAKGNATKTSIQGLGSTVQYLRRYLTLMIWNLTLSDKGQVFVTKEQANNIRSMMDAAEVTGERMYNFLKFCGAESIETIGSFRYNDVMIMLKRAEANKRRMAQNQ